MYKGIIPTNEKKFPYNEKVISYIVNNYFKNDENINKDKLIEMIEKHESNQYTATYYITKKYILKINYDEKENNDKLILKLKNNNCKKNTNNEENSTINKKENSSHNKLLLLSSINKDKEKDKDKDKKKGDLSNIKKEMPKLDLNNINFISINENNNNKPYTLRGISPPNELKNIYDFNCNNNNNLNKYKTDDNIKESKNKNKENNIRNDMLYIGNYNYYNKGNKAKKNETIPFLSKTDENIKLDKEKYNNDKNNPLIKENLKTECNIIQEKKMNEHRKKYLNIIPKLNISNLNISNNNKKKYINFINYIDNKDNCIYLNSNCIINHSKSKNKNYSLYCYNRNNNSNKNKNYIFSYLNKDYSKEKTHKRNSSTIIKNQIPNSKTKENNKILFTSKIGLLSKVKNDNNYIMLNNNVNLSRNEKNEICRTKRLELTKSLEKNHYIITPRTLEQKKNNRIRTNNIKEQFRGILDLKEIEKEKKWKWNNNKIKKNLNLNQNDLTNINNIRNNNNKFINKYYFNNGNIINNNNNIILNIKNYYDRKNNKMDSYNNKKGLSK
jgi:hypothetical protein